MAQSYTRQSSFADGDTITAALFNNEYNQLVNAFSYSSTNEATTGHRHDGNAGEGGNIPQIGDLDFLNKIVVDSTNNRWGFYVEVSSVAVEQLRLQDGALIPVTDSDVDLGTSSLYFKDAYIDTVTTTGNVSIGGNLTVTGNATISGNLTFGDADTDSINLAAEIDSDIIPNTDGTYDLGSATKEWQDLYIDGTANIDSLVADTADINGGTIDGATIATSDITVGAGKTLDVSAGTLTLADDQISGDKVEGGTIAATTITSLTATSADINSGTIDGVTIGGTTAGAVTFTDLSDGTITIAGFADEDNMISDSATLLPTQQSVKAYVDSQVTAQDLDITTDSGTIAIDLDSETLTVTGGTGLDSSATGNAVTLAIDSTVATLTGSQTLTNKTIDVDSNTVTNIEVDNLKSGVLDTDLTSVAATDTTLASAKAIKTYVDTQVTAQDLDFQGDTGGALSIDLDSESLTIAGGTGLDTVGSGNTVTVNIDSTVATLTGTQTLTNKTLTSPDVNTPDIDGGTIDATTIGGATPAAGSFTTLSSSSGITGTLQTAAQPNITSVGTLTSLNIGTSMIINNTASSTFGTIEVAGTSGAFIDLKSPSSDDFDLRIITTGTGGNINASSGGTVNLQVANSTVLSTASTGVAVTGTLSATGDITGTLATAAQPNITSVGTLTTLTVDDITINASSISDAGDLTIDVGGDLNFDADGGDIILKDGGTSFGKFVQNSSNFHVVATVQDKDIKFFGNDGGSSVTALTLDMSDAGKAIFNAGATFGSDIDVTGTTNVTSVSASSGIDSTALMNVKADGTNDTVINVGLNTASNHYAYVDLIGDSTYTDYGLRIIRNNGGANTSSGIHHRGTGELFFRTDDAGEIKFETNGSEAMRIDSLGNLLVGTTSIIPSNSSTEEGISLATGSYGGFLSVSRDGGTAAAFNRMSSDGQILDFRKDGSTVGSIGSVSGYLYVGGTAGNDAFLSLGADGVRPATSAGAARDAAIDLGGSSNRFKDLHLSGTAYTNGVTTTGNLIIGTEDNNAAVLEISGGPTGSTEGGELRLDLAADHDGTYEFYRIDVFEDDLRIGRAGTTDITLDSSGNVGIGTASNSGKIQANAADSQVAVMAAGDVSDPLYPAFGFDGQIGSNGGRGAGMYLPSDNTLAFSTAGEGRVIIDSSGNVGIGTSNPQGKLDVESSSNNVFDIARFGSSTSDNSEITLGYFDATATNGIPSLIGSSDFGGLIQGGENGHLVLGIRDNDVTDAVDIISGGGNFMTDSTYDTLVATFKANGNVGIGTQNPSAALEVQGATLVSDDGADDFIKQSVSGTTSTLTFGNTESTGGQAKWEYTRGTGKLSGNIGAAAGTNFMTVLGTGNVGLKGQSSPESLLHIGSSSNSLGGTTDDSISNLILHTTTSNGDKLIFSTRRTSTGTDWQTATHRIQRKVDSTLMGYMQFGSNSDDLITFGENASELMRIDGSGNLLVGTTSTAFRGNHTIASGSLFSTTIAQTKTSSGASILNLDFSGATPNNTADYFIYAEDASAVRFRVFSNGNVENVNNSYGALSDEKLKENIVDATDKLEDLKQVKVRNYNLIGNDKKQIGVIAQELETIFPSMVEEKPDLDDDNNDLGTTTKSVKYSVFVPILIKAIQEQQTQIEALQSEINLLKGE